MTDQDDPTEQIPATPPPPPTSAAPPPPPTAPPPPKDADGGDGRRWKTWHLVVASVVALFLGIGIGAAGGETEDGPEDVGAASESPTTTEGATTTTAEVKATTTEATTTTTAEPPTTTTTAAPPPPQDQVIAEFSGSGTQAVRPFSVSDGWEIQWDFEGDILQIYLNDEGGDFVDIPANQQGSGSGSSYQGAGGTFYLETNAIGNWTIRIVDVP